MPTFTPGRVGIPMSCLCETGALCGCGGVSRGLLKTGVLWWRHRVSLLLCPLSEIRSPSESTELKWANWCLFDFRDKYYSWCCNIFEHKILSYSTFQELLFKLWWFFFIAATNTNTLLFLRFLDISPSQLWSKLIFALKMAWLAFFEQAYENVTNC